MSNESMNLLDSAIQDKLCEWFHLEIDPVAGALKNKKFLVSFEVIVPKNLVIYTYINPSVSNEPITRQVGVFWYRVGNGMKVQKW